MSGVLHGGVERVAARWGSWEAVRFGDIWYSFGELDGLSNAFARYLAARRVGLGDRVAVMSSNRPELVVAVLAISKVGAAAVLMDPAWGAVETGVAVDLTGPRHAVADAAGAGILADLLGDTAVSDLDHPGTVRAGFGGRGGPLPCPAVTPFDEAVLVFSPDRAGTRRAVRHTHRSITRATGQWRAALGLGAHDRFQVATPPVHVLDLLTLLAALSAGATVRLHRWFDLDVLLDRIACERMTLDVALAPHVAAVADHPGLDEGRLASLRYLLARGPVAARPARAVTARTGVGWLSVHGTNEVPVIAANPVGDPRRWRLDSAGPVAAGVELRVADLDTGAILGAGGTGELQVRSPTLMAGQLPDTAPDPLVDGWCRTGGVGWLEADGWLHVIDRSVRPFLGGA